MDLCVLVLTQITIDKQSKFEKFEAAKKQQDEEEIEQFEEVIAKMDRVWDYVMDISGTLLKTMPD